VSDLRAYALRLLARRDYTAAELQEKLEAREYADDAIRDAIAALTRQGLIDDRRVAAAFIRTASRVKGRGRMRIARELEARGVARATVRELVAELAPDDEMATLKTVLARMRPPSPDDPAARRKLVQRLLRRGFSYDAISKALRTRLDEDD
jgi:regulatory protein